MRPIVSAVLSVLVFVLVAFGLNLAGCDRDSNQSPLIAWNKYSGEIPGYTVIIDESNNGSGFRRMVHLYPGGAHFSVGAITGHDHDNDGHWDRVFLNCYPSTNNGCNSYSIPVSGPWRWEPCRMDADTLTPFHTGEIMAAIRKLDDAMIAVHNDAHRSDKLAEWKRLEAERVK